MFNHFIHSAVTFRKLDRTYACCVCMMAFIHYVHLNGIPGGIE